MLKVTNAILSARDVSLVIAGRTILDKVNIDVRSNEIVTIIGPNGAGKSTLVRCLLGLQPITSGEVIKQKNLRVGYVPQRFPQLPNVPLDVRRLLSLTLRPSETEIEEALEETGIPHLKDASVSRLSGGELQRALLAHCSPAQA